MLLMATGCGGGGAGWYVPQPTPERAVTVVEAPFERAWDAVIDRFAFNNIPIATIDRSSGLIVAKTNSGLGPVGGRGADCGAFKDKKGNVTEGRPSGAAYNVLVRASGGSRSTVRVTISWDGGLAIPPEEARELETRFFPCLTTGVFEAELERSIKERAEAAP